MEGTSCCYKGYDQEEEKEELEARKRGRRCKKQKVTIVSIP